MILVIINLHPTWKLMAKQTDEHMDTRQTHLCQLIIIAKILFWSGKWRNTNTTNSFTPGLICQCLRQNHHHYVFALFCCEVYSPVNNITVWLASQLTYSHHMARIPLYMPFIYIAKSTVASKKIERKQYLSYTTNLTSYSPTVLSAATSWKYTFNSTKIIHAAHSLCVHEQKQSYENRNPYHPEHRKICICK